MSGTGVVNGPKPNSGSYGEAASIGKEIWNSRIRDSEGVKRILNWHTEGARLKGAVVPGTLNGSGTIATAAADESKNERTTLKSENTCRYLSQMSRTNEP